MGDMNPTDYRNPYTAPINHDPCPTEADVAELAQKAIKANDAAAEASYHYSRANQERSRWLNDTARILAEAEAKERAAASAYRASTQAALDAYSAHIKATA
jgi:hypothetical protein